MINDNWKNVYCNKNNYKNVFVRKEVPIVNGKNFEIPSHMVENQDYFRETKEGKELLKMGLYMYGTDNFPNPITRDLLIGFWQNELNEKRERKSVDSFSNSNSKNSTNHMLSRDTTAFRFFLHDQYTKGFPGLLNPEWCINRVTEYNAQAATTAETAVTITASEHDSDQSFDSSVQVTKRKYTRHKKNISNQQTSITSPSVASDASSASVVLPPPPMSAGCDHSASSLLLLSRSPPSTLLTNNSTTAASTTVTPYNATTSSTSSVTPNTTAINNTATTNTTTVPLAATTNIDNVDMTNTAVNTGFPKIVSPYVTHTEPDTVVSRMSSDVSTTKAVPIKMPTDRKSFLDKLLNNKNTIKSETITSNSTAVCSSNSSNNATTENNDIIIIN